MDSHESLLRQEIQERITTIFNQRLQKKKFIPGKTWVQYAGSVMDDKEINAGVKSLIDGWFGLGKKGEEFELNLAKFTGVKGIVGINSFVADVSKIHKLGWKAKIDPKQGVERVISRYQKLL